MSTELLPNGAAVATRSEPNVTRREEVVPRPDPARQRLQSLDAYRGLIMITLAFVGFGLASTAVRHLDAMGTSSLAAGAVASLGSSSMMPLGELASWQPRVLATRGVLNETSAWGALRYQFDHAEWVGCGYWDLIQPSFMFMVGAAMAFSYLRRQKEGQSYLGMLGHAFTRSLILIFLGIFLISNNRPTTNWSLMCVLSQIGLGYTFLFLLWGRSFRTQALVAAGILVATWLIYMLYPTTGVAGGAPEIGITKEWAEKYLKDVNPHWHKNANAGHALDVWLLNLLPTAQPFVFNDGGYQTLNFLPSLATMIFGLMCGELLRMQRPASFKLLTLIAAGLAGLLLGELLDRTGICPIVKRIWTPSWAVYSTGWCCLILAFLYGIIDVLGFRRWSFPLVVVGMNSIAIYCMGMMLKPWTASVWRTHFGQDIFLRWGPLWQPTLEALVVGCTFWLVCYWMYRQKIFVRI